MPTIGGCALWPCVNPDEQFPKLGLNALKGGGYIRDYITTLMGVY